MFPVAMLACLAAGRPFVALDPHYPANWLSQVLADARPALIIGREDGLRGIDTGEPAARVIDLTRLPQGTRKGWRPTELGMDEPACVVFTSGSTGRPKGIVNSQRNLLQRAFQSINAAHVNAEDRFLTLAALWTIVGVRDLITALLAGASVHLLDPQRSGAREILNVIRAEAITILFAFPALLRSVIAYGGERAGDALRLVRIGGDTTLWSDIDLLRAWLVPEAAIQLIYAATEAPMMQWFVNDACRGDDARIPIGYPLPGNHLALIDEYGRNTLPGEVGELVVSERSYGASARRLHQVIEHHAASSPFRAGPVYQGGTAAGAAHLRGMLSSRRSAWRQSRALSKLPLESAIMALRSPYCKLPISPFLGLDIINGEGIPVSCGRDCRSGLKMRMYL